MPLDSPVNFSYPQHDVSGAYHENPIAKFQRHSAKHGAAELHNYNLKRQYQQGYNNKHYVFVQAVEGGMDSAEAAYVE